MVVSICRNVFYIFYLLTYLFSVKCSKQTEEKRILDIIVESGAYDTGIRPLGSNSTDYYDGPCVVDTDVFVKSVSDLDDHKMKFTMQLTLRQYWTDNRLVFKHLLNTNESRTHIPIRYLSLRDINQIWTPDLFFNEEIEARIHDTMKPNHLIRIYPEGRVHYSCRITLTVSCPMDLQSFPFDTQVCAIKIASYSYMTDDLVLSWRNTSAVQVAANIYLPRFNVSAYDTSHFTIRTATGQYSGVRLTITFKRQYGYYIIQFYLPCSLLVAISWLSFWLSEISSEARLSLVFTDLITLSLLVVAINTTLPAVSYIKAVDVYTGVCTLFVIASIFQFTIVTLVDLDEKRKKIKQRTARRVSNSGSNGQLKNSDDLMAIRFRGNSVDNQPKKQTDAQRNKCANLRSRLFLVDVSRSQQIDGVCKVLFPLSFIVFIVVYWIKLFLV